MPLNTRKAQDGQKGRPFCPSFVKRRSSLVAEPAAACSQDTLHDSRFTGVENAAGGLFHHPAKDTVPPVTPAHLSQWLTPVVESLRTGTSKPCLTGLHGSTAGFSLALLTQNTPSRPLAERSWLVVAKTDDDAERLYRNTLFYRTLCGLSGDDLALFPKWETLPYESTAPHIDLVARRMQTLNRLCTAARTVLFTSIPALTQRVLPALVFTDAVLQF